MSREVVVKSVKIEQKMLCPVPGKVRKSGICQCIP